MIGIRLLIDENLPPIFESVALKYAVTAQSIAGAGAAHHLAGKSDDEVITYALRNGLCIVTSNQQDYLALYRGITHDNPGFILLKQHYIPKKCLDRAGLIAAFEHIISCLPASGLTGLALYYRWKDGNHQTRLDRYPYHQHAGW